MVLELTDKKPLELFRFKRTFSTTHPSLFHLGLSGLTGSKLMSGNVSSCCIYYHYLLWVTSKTKITYNRNITLPNLLFLSYNRLITDKELNLTCKSWYISRCSLCLTLHMVGNGTVWILWSYFHVLLLSPWSLLWGSAPEVWELSWIQQDWGKNPQLSQKS